ncbi:MAG: DUF4390 domain-containing protein [Acidobacteria bacterium]|nr:DUF4390 domain-containing protein [Acidobacteriota bacterium]
MRATLALLLGFLAFAARARAEAKITDFQVALDGNQVFASLNLAGAFDRRFVARVDAGLPTAIVYRFELDLVRHNWWDPRLKSCSLEVAAIYDAIDRIYTVHFRLDDKLIESRTVHDRKALEAAMTRIDRLPVFSIANLHDRRRMLLRARAELGSRTVLSFVPVLITTDWVESEKFRPAWGAGAGQANRTQPEQP